MTALQARLLAARAVQAAQEQERFAQQLRPHPGADIPAQRTGEETAAPALSVVRASV